jgi:hypothetical protein
MYHTPAYLDSACLKQEPAQYHTIPEHAGHTISYIQQNIRSHNIPHQATLNHTNNLITSPPPGYRPSPSAAHQLNHTIPYSTIPHHTTSHSIPPHHVISDHSIQQRTKPYHYSHDLPSNWILPVSASSPATMEITIGDP